MHDLRNRSTSNGLHLIQAQILQIQRWQKVAYSSKTTEQKKVYPCRVNMWLRDTGSLVQSPRDTTVQFTLTACAYSCWWHTFYRCCTSQRDCPIQLKSSSEISTSSGWFSWHSSCSFQPLLLVSWLSWGVWMSSIRTCLTPWLTWFSSQISWLKIFS